MDNFKVIYKILRILEKAMDFEDFDKSCISKERLELTEARWNRIIAMLVTEGYVTGIDVWESFDFGYPRVRLTCPEITIKGLKYLEENSVTKKVAGMTKKSNGCCDQCNLAHKTLLKKVKLRRRNQQKGKGD